MDCKQTYNVKSLNQSRKEKIKKVCNIVFDEIFDKDFKEGIVKIGVYEGIGKEIRYGPGELEQLKTKVYSFLDDEFVNHAEVLWGGADNIVFAFKLDMEDKYMKK